MNGNAHCKKVVIMLLAFERLYVSYYVKEND